MGRAGHLLRNRAAEAALSAGAASLKVTLFCGGRGSAAVIREFLRRDYIDLTLLVNAYDDGLSTGLLRDLIPGLLGPSDFRKNLAHLIEFHSLHQYAIAALLELRLPDSTTVAEELGQLEAFARGRLELRKMPGYLRELFQAIDPLMGEHLKHYLVSFFDFYHQSGRNFDFRDCSLGNLIFAGAFLQHGQTFNQAVVELSRLLQTRAHLIDVTEGGNRVLAALKANGEVLECEAKIVAPQSPSPIIGLYLLEKKLTASELAVLAGLELAQKKASLEALDRPDRLSARARAAILASDLVVYGAGTQHSSLFPSYRTIGLREALEQSPARLKAFMANLQEDHDIQGLGVQAVVERALGYLGDTTQEQQLITHVFTSPGGLPADQAGWLSGHGAPDTFPSPFSSWIWRPAQIANPTHPEFHSGERVVSLLLDEWNDLQGGERKSGRELTIYIDLHQRSMALRQLIDEFLEIPWQTHFSRTRLIVNHAKVAPQVWPNGLSLESAQEERLFSDVGVFRRWLEQGDSPYLVTLTGDGAYHLRDILKSITFMRQGYFGAVFGSRNQSRRQRRQSLQAAYGEAGYLHVLGAFAGVLSTLAFWLRFDLIFSDPFTGFRVYSRAHLSGLKLAPARRESSSLLTRALLAHGVTIIELPINYTTFQGFTQLGWRIKRGIINMITIFG